MCGQGERKIVVLPQVKQRMNASSPSTSQIYLNFGVRFFSFLSLLADSSPFEKSHKPSPVLAHKYWTSACPSPCVKAWRAGLLPALGQRTRLWRWRRPGDGVENNQPS